MYVWVDWDLIRTVVLAMLNSGCIQGKGYVKNSFSTRRCIFRLRSA